MHLGEEIDNYDGDSMANETAGVNEVMELSICLTSKHILSKSWRLAAT